MSRTWTGPARRKSTLHGIGLVQNGAKNIGMKRELPRLISSVRKILWRSRGTLVMWTERDLTQARAHGNKFFGFTRLAAPYRGFAIEVGSRALLVLRARAPEA